jgi:quercetin dioxygenase-like cupin family protein
MAKEIVRIVPKGWGQEAWLVNKREYCGKLLLFKKGKKCSWHYHKLKDKTFYVQSGRLEVWFSYYNEIEMADKVILESGDVFHIPMRIRHQLLGLEDTQVLELSTQHFDNDFYRLIQGD